MSLADGRNSTAFSSPLPAYCPVNFYVEMSASAAPTCLQCPKDRSITVGVNQLSDKSCVCNVGNGGCIACPKIKPASEGFNCSLTNQSRPAIRAGFYIDYSMLNECSEYDPKCDAIIKFPNPDACPGTKEKECVQTDDACYDTETFGCASCCPKYFIENLKCFPCPASQLPLCWAWPQWA